MSAMEPLSDQSPTAALSAVSNAAHWSTVSPNPISESATGLVKRQLLERRASPIHSQEEFWRQTIGGKDLLDIGVVEHTAEFIERPNWRHGLLSRMASRSLGIDILPKEISLLQQRGFNVRVADATSDLDMGERFDVVYCGDVIEHVNEPVKLIQFAVRHLKPGGKAYFSTPCPFWYRSIFWMIQDETYIGNVDHLMWITPVNALELAHRAGVKLEKYHNVETYGKTFLRKVGHALVKMFFGRTEFFTWQYVFVFTAADGR